MRSPAGGRDGVTSELRCDAQAGWDGALISECNTQAFRAIRIPAGRMGTPRRCGEKGAVSTSMGVASPVTCASASLNRALSAGQSLYGTVATVMIAYGTVATATAIALRSPQRLPRLTTAGGHGCNSLQPPIEQPASL